MNLTTRSSLLCLLILGGTLLCSHQGVEAGEVKNSGALEIYFVDTEGGAATLVLTPAGESLLIDPGYPGERDPGRINGVARKVAGLDHIDIFVSTHWDADHFASLPRLTELIPIRRFYDRGVPRKLPKGKAKDIEAYQRVTKGNSKVLGPGDEIPLRQAASSPALRTKVVTASGLVLGEKLGAPQVGPCEKGHASKPEDTSENAQSLAILLTFGDFRLFAGGDLTWNVEHKLACPRNIPGEVDVYQVNHHGFAFSNNPVLLRALNPRVAILLNGPTKGGDAETFARLKSLPRLDSIFQMHRNLRTGEKDNAPPEFVLSTADQKTCKGGYIRLSVQGDGKSYTVSIPAKGTSRTYRVGK